MITAILALFLLSPSPVYLDCLSRTGDHAIAKQADYQRTNGGNVCR
jgi:hypothetical protein